MHALPGGRKACVGLAASSHLRVNCTKNDHVGNICMPFFVVAIQGMETNTHGFINCLHTEEVVRERGGANEADRQLKKKNIHLTAGMEKERIF